MVKANEYLPISHLLVGKRGLDRYTKNPFNHNYNGNIELITTSSRYI